MYEPCHGSAPDIAGQNVANPIAMIASLAMALKYSLNEEKLSRNIDNAIKVFINEGHRTKDISTDGNFLTTSEVAPIIIEILKRESVH
jgi:3-isopropylmalate dehydrogenase